MYIYVHSGVCAEPDLRSLDLVKSIVLVGVLRDPVAQRRTLESALSLADENKAGIMDQLRMGAQTAGDTKKKNILYPSRWT